jgi:hypothetical protein
MDSSPAPSGAPAEPCCCCRKFVRTWCGAVSMILGLVLVIIGGTFRGNVIKATTTLLQANLVIPGALDVPIVSARIAADVYGGPPGSLPFSVATAAGTSSDDDDNGLANDYYVPSITNVAAILAAPAGAAAPPAPVVTEIGPLAYRSYSVVQQDCATCGVKDGVQTWYERKWVRYDAANSAAGFQDHSFGGPFDTTYVTVPNANYRGLEATLSKLTGGSIGSFEALAVPLLGLQGLGQLTAPGALNAGLKVLTFPLMMNALVITADAMGLIPDNFISSVPSAEAVGYALSLGGADVYPAGLAAMSDSVPTALFQPSSPATAAVSPLTAAGWALTVAALSDCPAAAAGVPGAGAACTSYSTALYSAAGDYPATPAGQQLLQRDVAAILSYYGALLAAAPHAQASSAQLLAEGYAAGALHMLQGQLGCSGASCDINSWADAVFVQLANNGVTALVMGAGVLANIPSGLSAPAQAQAVTQAQVAYQSLGGTGPANLCSASALAASPFLSLADTLPLPGGQVPEFSCWTARANPASFGSKIAATTLKAVIGTAADPAVNVNTGAPTSLSGGGNMVIMGVPLAGTGGISNTGAFLAAAQQMAAAVGAEVASGTPGPYHAEVLVLGAFAALRAAPTLQSAITAYATAVAGAGAAPCPLLKGNLLGLPLRCFEILDLAAWLNHVAKDIVFDASFAKVGPRMFNATSNSFVPLKDPYYVSRGLFNEPSALRAGPFLRCTLREYIEIGCHDNLQDFAVSLLSPGSQPGSYTNRMPPVGLTSYEGVANDAAWVAYKASNQPNKRYTGGSDISQVDVIAAYSVGNTQVTTIADFGGPAGSAAQTNPVTGSYSGNAFAPTLKVALSGKEAVQDYAAAWPAISVWVWQGLRACSLAFSSQVVDPAGAGLKLWRFALDAGAAAGAEPSAAQWAAAIPRMKTDDAATTPSCSANVAPLHAGVRLYLAPPYFAGCQTKGLSGAPVPGYTLTPGTPAAARNPAAPATGVVTFVDVEPITGRTMNAHKRLGAHMYWGGQTAWFNLKPTYGLIYWVDQHGSVTLPTAKKLVDALALADRAATSGTGILVALGVILGLVGAVSTFIGCRMPKAPSDFDAAPGGATPQPNFDTKDGMTFDVANPTASVVFRAVPPTSAMSPPSTSPPPTTTASAPPPPAPPAMAPPAMVPPPPAPPAMVPPPPAPPAMAPPPVPQQAYASVV